MHTYYDNAIVVTAVVPRRRSQKLIATCDQMVELKLVAAGRCPSAVRNQLGPQPLSEPGHRYPVTVLVRRRGALYYLQNGDCLGISIKETTICMPAATATIGSAANRTSSDPACAR